MEQETAARRTFAYQPALDGLRGIAVAAVVVYHGNLRYHGRWGGGGFLGVDLFFVLSGFLITSLLVVEYDRAGGIELRSFWQRRVRRLFPALGVLLVLVALYAAVSPAHRAGLRSDTIFTLLYIQNWHLIWSHGVTASSPLSHTWSLSVEEQWYLVWPVVLFFALRSRVSLRTLVAIVVVLAVASAVWTSVLFSPFDTSRAYFGTDTRAQELLVGAALALLLINRGPLRRLSLRYGLEVVAWFCAAFLGYQLLHAQITDSFLYRGGYLLIAVAAGIVIAAVTHSDGLLRRTLSVKPLVLLGLISYGVYLYHRPIFAMLSPERVGVTGHLLFIVRAACAIGFAALSYRFLERPIRNGTLKINRPDFVVAAALVTAGSVIFLVIVGDPQLPSSTHLAPATIAYFAQRGTSAPPHATKVLVAGETLAFVLQEHLGDTFNGGGISGLAFGLYGCGIDAGSIVIASGAIPQQHSCGEWPDTFRQLVAAYRPDVVALMVGEQEIFDRAIGDQLLPVGTPAWEEMVTHQLDLARAALTSGGARLVVVTSPCPSTAVAIAAFKPVERDPSRLAAVNTALRKYAVERGLQVVDLAARLCPHGQPLRRQDGRVISVPATGLTDDGATFIWKTLAAQVQPTG